jgi:cyanophycinase
MKSERAPRRCLPLASSLLCGLLLVPTAIGADGPSITPEGRLRPSGLEGTVILDAGARPSGAEVVRFARLIGDNKITVLLIGDGDSDGLVDLLLAKQVKDVAILRLPSAAAARAAQLSEALKKSKGVWILAHDEPAKVREILNPIAGAIRDVRLRGGVVAASETAAWILPARYLDGQGQTRDGLNVLPGMLVGRDAKPAGNVRTFDTALAEAPGILGVGLSGNAVLVAGGRELASLGTGHVAFHLARSATRDSRTVDLAEESTLDYNELRRAASGRAGTAYPPKDLPPPEVAKGTLVIVGGGGMPAEISKRFVELGHGEKGTFIVLPISNEDPLPANNGDGFLRRHGAKDIVVIKAREQKDLEMPENLAALKRATAVWFGGGRQWRFVDAYEGTKIPELFRDVLRRGGVIGGSSAGATIQGDYLCRGAPGGPNNIVCEGYEKALGFLPGVAIDQHFTQRNRFKDMVLLMKTYPQFLGIGLDEATAIVVQGHVAEVMGPNQVHFYDRRKPVVEGKPDHESFKAGARYDLKERKALETKEVK